MQLNFKELLAGIDPNAAFRIANTARPAPDYLFNQFLPEEQRTSYHADRATMTVRATMAGLAGMDSPYPPGGFVQSTKFVEQLAKVANQVPLNEQTLRQLHELANILQNAGSFSNDRMIEQILNFTQKVIVQPHLDTFEWLRGQALTTGAINWTFGQIPLVVSYGIPSGNLLTERTDATAWHDTGSLFWQDMRTLKRLVGGSVRAYVAHPDTIDAIRYNAANNIVATEEGAGGVLFRRTVNSGANFSQDTNDTTRLISYDREADVLNPADQTATIKVPFMARGYIIAIGNNTQDGFAVNIGTGGTADPDSNNRVGYTHIGPTVEGGGAPGRWSQVYTPENQPWSIVGRGVTNGLPVIEAPTKIAVARSELANP